ncbi:MAG: lipid A biosynthesis acyltransferase [Bacteroidetes bacterium]|nr:MAG: lipid A biosynthesis acyltransferase [Bacteroidota bacterium]
MQFIAYILIYPFLLLISILPFRLLYVLSDLIYVLIYKVFGYRKKVVIENLNLVFPEKSKHEINKITKAFYHHLCDLIVESIKSMTISETQIANRMILTNIEEIHRAEKANKSIVLMMAHYGNWEWTFILQKDMNHINYAIYKRIENKHFDRLIKRIRAKYNSYLITTKETISILTQSKEKGELTINGFASDQTPKLNKAHHWNNFMGIKVPLHTGAEMLAKKLDMSVMYLGIKKIKRGFYEATLTNLADNARDFNNYEITDAFLKLVEQQINEAPEYYLWTHKRWKHRDKVPE